MEVRGQVATLQTPTWNPQNFAGFYYDIKKDIGTENTQLKLTGDNKLSGDSPDYGVIYTPQPRTRTSSASFGVLIR